MYENASSIVITPWEDYLVLEYGPVLTCCNPPINNPSLTSVSGTLNLTTMETVNDFDISDRNRMTNDVSEIETDSNETSNEICACVPTDAVHINVGDKTLGMKEATSTDKNKGTDIDIFSRPERTIVITSMELPSTLENSETSTETKFTTFEKLYKSKTESYDMQETNRKSKRTDGENIRTINDAENSTQDEPKKSPIKELTNEITNNDTLEDAQEDLNIAHLELADEISPDARKLSEETDLLFYLTSTFKPPLLSEDTISTAYNDSLDDPERFNDLDSTTNNLDLPCPQTKHFTSFELGDNDSYNKGTKLLTPSNGLYSESFNVRVESLSDDVFEASSIAKGIAEGTESNMDNKYKYRDSLSLSSSSGRPCEIELNTTADYVDLGSGLGSLSLSSDLSNGQSLNVEKQNDTRNDKTNNENETGKIEAFKHELDTQRHLSESNVKDNTVKKEQVENHTESANVENSSAGSDSTFANANQLQFKESMSFESQDSNISQAAPSSDNGSFALGQLFETGYESEVDRCEEFICSQGSDQFEYRQDNGNFHENDANNRDTETEGQEKESIDFTQEGFDSSFDEENKCKTSHIICADQKHEWIDDVDMTGKEGKNESETEKEIKEICEITPEVKEVKEKNIDQIKNAPLTNKNQECSNEDVFQTNESVTYSIEKQKHLNYKIDSDQSSETDNDINETETNERFNILEDNEKESFDSMLMDDLELFAYNLAFNIIIEAVKRLAEEQSDTECIMELNANDDDITYNEENAAEFFKITKDALEDVVSIHGKDQEREITPDKALNDNETRCESFEKAQNDHEHESNSNCEINQYEGTEISPINSLEEHIENLTIFNDKSNKRTAYLGVDEDNQTHYELNKDLSSDNEIKADTVELSPNCTETAELSPNCTETAELSPNCTETAELSPNCTETAELSPNCTETAELSPNCIETAELSPNCTETAELSPNGTETAELSSNVTETAELSPNVTETAELSPNGTETAESISFDDSSSDNDWVFVDIGIDGVVIEAEFGSKEASIDHKMDNFENDDKKENGGNGVVIEAEFSNKEVSIDHKIDNIENDNKKENGGNEVEVKIDHEKISTKDEANVKMKTHEHDVKEIEIEIEKDDKKENSGNGIEVKFDQDDNSVEDEANVKMKIQDLKEIEIEREDMNIENIIEIKIEIGDINIECSKYDNLEEIKVDTYEKVEIEKSQVKKNETEKINVLPSFENAEDMDMETIEINNANYLKFEKDNIDINEKKKDEVDNEKEITIEKHDITLDNEEITNFEKNYVEVKVTAELKISKLSFSIENKEEIDILKDDRDIKNEEIDNISLLNAGILEEANSVHTTEGSHERKPISTIEKHVHESSKHVTFGNITDDCFNDGVIDHFNSNSGNFAPQSGPNHIEKKRPLSDIEEAEECMDSSVLTTFKNLTLDMGKERSELSDVSVLTCCSSMEKQDDVFEEIAEMGTSKETDNFNAIVEDKTQNTSTDCLIGDMSYEVDEAQDNIPIQREADNDQIKQKKYSLPVTDLDNNLDNDKGQQRVKDLGANTIENDRTKTELVNKLHVKHSIVKSKSEEIPKPSNLPGILSGNKFTQYASRSLDDDRKDEKVDNKIRGEIAGSLSKMLKSKVSFDLSRRKEYHQTTRLHTYDKTASDTEGMQKTRFHTFEKTASDTEGTQHEFLNPNQSKNRQDRSISSDEANRIQRQNSWHQEGSRYESKQCLIDAGIDTGSCSLDPQWLKGMQDGNDRSFSSEEREINAQESLGRSNRNRFRYGHDRSLSSEDSYNSTLYQKQNRFKYERSQSSEDGLDGYRQQRRSMYQTSRYDPESSPSKDLINTNDNRLDPSYASSYRHIKADSRSFSSERKDTSESSFDEPHKKMHRFGKNRSLSSEQNYTSNYKLYPKTERFKYERSQSSDEGMINYNHAQDQLYQRIQYEQDKDISRNPLYQRNRYEQDRAISSDITDSDMRDYLDKYGDISYTFEQASKDTVGTYEQGMGDYTDKDEQGSRYNVGTYDTDLDRIERTSNRFMPARSMSSEENYKSSLYQRRNPYEKYERSQSSEDGYDHYTQAWDTVPPVQQAWDTVPPVQQAWDTVPPVQHTNTYKQETWDNVPPVQHTNTYEGFTLQRNKSVSSENYNNLPTQKTGAEVVDRHKNGQQSKTDLETRRDRFKKYSSTINTTMQSDSFEEKNLNNDKKQKVTSGNVYEPSLDSPLIDQYSHGEVSQQMPRSFSLEPIDQQTVYSHDFGRHPESLQNNNIEVVNQSLNDTAFNTMPNVSHKADPNHDRTLVYGVTESSPADVPQDWGVNFQELSEKLQGIDYEYQGRLYQRVDYPPRSSQGRPMTEEKQDRRGYMAGLSRSQSVDNYSSNKGQTSVDGARNTARNLLVKQRSLATQNIDNYLATGMTPVLNENKNSSLRQYKKAISRENTTSQDFSSIKQVQGHGRYYGDNSGNNDKYYGTNKLESTRKSDKGGVKSIPEDKSIQYRNQIGSDHRKSKHDKNVESNQGHGNNQLKHSDRNQITKTRRRNNTNVRQLQRENEYGENEVTLDQYSQTRNQGKQGKIDGELIGDRSISQQINYSNGHVGVSYSTGYRGDVGSYSNNNKAQNIMPMQKEQKDKRVDNKTGTRSDRDNRGDHRQGDKHSYNTRDSNMRIPSQSQHTGDGPLSLSDAYGPMATSNSNHSNSNHMPTATSGGMSSNHLSGSMTSLNQRAAPSSSPSRQNTLQKQHSLQSTGSEVNGGQNEEGIKFERLKNLPEDDLFVKIKEIIGHFEKLEDFHRGDGMRIQKMLGDMYWDYTHMREMIGDCMADGGYAAVSMNMLRTLNSIGIFKNDDVWFPTYYTYNTMWNFTDASSKLAKALSDNDAVRLLTMNCGHKPYINAIHSKNVYYVIKASLSILHNIGRNSGIKHLFDENKTSETIMPFLESEDEMLKILATLTIANIVDEEENKSLIAETGTVHCIVNWIEKALSLPRRRYKGFTPQELTEGLNKLAVNDNNKSRILDEGALPLFLKMLQHEDVREQSSAARCIWTLAFDKEVRQRIKESEELIALLTKLTESTNKSLQMNCEGAMWVIRGDNDVTRESNEPAKQRPKSAKTKTHVFLSYSWSDKEAVLAIRDRLRAEGYAIWIDIEKMGGSTLEAMAAAVENSAVVLMCMSEKYKQSPNCRTEAEYTFQLKKDYIPIMMQKKYRPDGWLGLILGAKLYFDFSGKYPFEKSFQGLLKELRGRGKVTPNETPVENNDHPDTAIVHSSSIMSSHSHASFGTPVHHMPSSHSSAVLNMGQEELIKWLRHIKLTDCIPAFMEFDGKLLMQLKIMRTEAPEFFYSCLEKRLNMSLIEILKFTKALEELN